MQVYKITPWLNIFIVLKVNFSMIYDVIFTVNGHWSEMTKLCLADAKISFILVIIIIFFDPR